MKTEELRALFAKLPDSERLALDETIIDRGVTDFDELLKTLDVVQTYFDEQPSTKPSRESLLEQFKKSRRAITWSKDRCEENGIEKDSAEMLEYADQCFIEVVRPGHYHLTIETKEWFSNDLVSLEELLYHRWYNPME